MLVIMLNQKGYPYFYQRFEIEELRPVLEFVQTNRKPDDIAFLHSQGTHAYEFYSEFHEKASAFKIPNIEIEPWRAKPQKIPLAKNKRLWLIFSHVEAEEMQLYQEYLGEGYEVLEVFDREGARAVLLEN